MAVSETRIATPLAARYVTQLCEHFEHEHQFAVSYTADAGRIAFNSGACTLRAEPELLVIRAEAVDAASLDRIKAVIVRHLKRFAFRDKPDIEWGVATAA
jgi:uncharacterized protein